MIHKNAWKIAKDLVSYAHIPTNNMYYKEVLGQSVNKK